MDFRKNSAEARRTVEGYGRGAPFARQEARFERHIRAIIEKLFASPEVDYLQVNSTTAGCFTPH